MTAILVDLTGYAGSADFWRSVFVGSIFLLFDLLIIAMLIPLFIQRLEHRKWRDMRGAVTTYCEQFLWEALTATSQFVWTQAQSAEDVELGLAAAEARIEQARRKFLDRMSIAVVSVSPEMSRCLVKFVDQLNVWDAFKLQTVAGLVRPHQASLQVSTKSLRLLIEGSENLAASWRTMFSFRERIQPFIDALEALRETAGKSDWTPDFDDLLESLEEGAEALLERKVAEMKAEIARRENSDDVPVS